MSILIAKSTLHLGKTIRAKDTKNKNDRGEYEQVLKSPGEEFDPKEFGMGDKEVGELLRSGKAKRKVKVVDDDQPERHEPDARTNAPAETDQSGPRVVSNSAVSIRK